MPLLLALAGLFVSLAVPLRAGQAAPATPSVAARDASAKVWIGREAEFEQFLKTAPIEREEAIPVGVTRPRHVFFAPGGLAAGAVFKPLPPGRSRGFFESYQSEIAAYELDKLLALGMVPPTVERRYSRRIGSLQLWVEDVALLTTKDPSRSPNIAAWNRQVYRHRVWDDLIGNIDRNQGNLLVDPAWNLILIDHSRAFTNDQRLLFPLTKIDRELFARLKALDAGLVAAKVGPWLFDGPKALLERRDRIVARFERLIAEKGEAAVLIP